MNKKYISQCISLSTSMLFGMAGVTVAQAANDVESAAKKPAWGLEEVVVTAQKRAESVQDVPIAISALSAGSMDEKGISTVADIAQSIPNVTLDNTAPFSGSSSILVGYIRGIGQNDFAFNLDPGVGVYVDGVYLARNIGANSDLLDLERIEVLRGPQGTLFGRNTIGGAINIVTREPGEEFTYKLEATAGRYSRRDIRGSVDMPLVDGLLRSSVSFALKERDGYQKRIPFPGAENYVTNDFGQFPVTSQKRPNESGDENQEVVRAKLLFTPTDDLKITLAGDYLKTDEQATPASLLAVNQTGNFVPIYNACISTPAAVLATTPLAGICGPTGNPNSPTGVGPALAGVNVDADPNNDRLPYDNRFVTGDPDVSYGGGNNFSFIESMGFTATVDYDLNDALSLKSITAYRELEATFGVDIGGAPFVSLEPSFYDDEEQFSQELQLIGSAFDDRLDYVVGGYYFHEEGSHDDGVPFIGGLVQVYSPDNTYDTKAYAVFTHNNFQLIPGKLGITVGARYTEEDKTFTGAQRDENLTGTKLGIPPFFYPDATDLARVYPLGENEQNFYDFSFRLGMEYFFNDDVMLYSSVSNGFKSGGWTTRLTLPLGPGAEAPTFGPEESDTYELGVKATLWDKKLRLNAATFYTDYSDIQVTIQEGTSPVFINGGDGRITGFELEVNAAPTANLAIDASVGYLDAEYRELDAGVIGLNTGTDFVNTPTWSAQMGVSYQFETEKLGSFMPRIDYSYRSELANDAENTPMLIEGSTGLVNASMLYRAPGDHIEVQAGIKNLTDKRYLVSGYVNDTSIVTGVYNRPREWYVTLRYMY